MKERDFQTHFTRWLRYRYDGNAAFELKITHDKSIPFDALKDHQVAAIMLAKKGKLSYKIPDDTIGQKPFDCFMLSHTEAYVVIMFYTFSVKHFYMIDIEEWVREKEESPRKSLTEERAALIGTRLALG